MTVEQRTAKMWARALFETTNTRDRVELLREIYTMPFELRQLTRKAILKEAKKRKKR